MRSDERGVVHAFGILIILLLGIGIGAAASQGAFSGIAGWPVSTDQPRGIDAQESTALFGQPSTGEGPAGTGQSSSTSSPAPPPGGGGGSGGGGGGGSVKYLQATGMGPLDWAFAAFAAILVIGLIVSKLRGGRRGRTFTALVLLIVVAVVSAAILTAASGVDLDGDGDVDDSAGFGQPGVSALLIFDGAITNTDGTSEDLHATQPLLAIQRGSKELAALSLRTVFRLDCDNCSAEIQGGFVSLTAHRPTGHSEGPFFKEAKRMDIPKMNVQSGSPLELWRTSYDATALQNAIADADTLGTYFINLVGQVRMSIRDSASIDAKSFAFDFSWPNTQVGITNKTSETSTPGTPELCRFTRCVLSVALVGQQASRWWFLNLQGLPAADSKAVLADLGVLR